jgi:hypothetical protein
LTATIRLQVRMPREECASRHSFVNAKLGFLDMLLTSIGKFHLGLQCDKDGECAIRGGAGFSGAASGAEPDP